MQVRSPTPTKNSKNSKETMSPLPNENYLASTQCKSDMQKIALALFNTAKTLVATSSNVPPACRIYKIENNNPLAPLIVFNKRKKIAAHEKFFHALRNLTEDDCQYVILNYANKLLKINIEKQHVVLFLLTKEEKLRLAQQLNFTTSRFLDYLDWQNLQALTNYQLVASAENNGYEPTYGVIQVTYCDDYIIYCAKSRNGTLMKGKFPKTASSNFPLSLKALLDPGNSYLTSVCQTLKLDPCYFEQKENVGSLFETVGRGKKSALKKELARLMPSILVADKEKNLLLKDHERLHISLKSGSSVSIAALYKNLYTESKLNPRQYSLNKDDPQHYSKMVMEKVARNTIQFGGKCGDITALMQCLNLRWPEKKAREARKNLSANDFVLSTLATDQFNHSLCLLSKRNFNLNNNREEPFCLIDAWGGFSDVVYVNGKEIESLCSKDKNPALFRFVFTAPFNTTFKVYYQTTIDEGFSAHHQYTIEHKNWPKNFWLYTKKISRAAQEKTIFTAAPSSEALVLLQPTTKKKSLSVEDFYALTRNLSTESTELLVQSAFKKKTIVIKNPWDLSKLLIFLYDTARLKVPAQRIYELIAHHDSEDTCFFCRESKAKCEQARPQKTPAHDSEEFVNLFTRRLYEFLLVQKPRLVDNSSYTAKYTEYLYVFIRIMAEPQRFNTLIFLSEHIKNFHIIDSLLPLLREEDHFPCLMYFKRLIKEESHLVRALEIIAIRTSATIPAIKKENYTTFLKLFAKKIKYNKNFSFNFKLIFKLLVEKKCAPELKAIYIALFKDCFQNYFKQINEKPEKPEKAEKAEKHEATNAALKQFLQDECSAHFIAQIKKTVNSPYIALFPEAIQKLLANHPQKTSQLLILSLLSKDKRLMQERTPRNKKDDAPSYKQQHK